MRIALCDTDISNIKTTKQMIYKYANLHKLEVLVDVYLSAEELLFSDVRYSMLLIEYRAKKIDGLETAKLLRCRGITGAIVFFCACAGSILDSFKVNPYRFLLKPMAEEKLFPVLDDFFAAYGSDFPLWIKNGDDTVCLNTGEILYLEAANKHCYINLKNERLLCRKTMARVFAALPHGHFLKINRAFIVNLNYVTAYNNEAVVLSDGTRLHISRNYYKSFKTEYREFVCPKEL